MREYVHIQECEGTCTPNVTVKYLGPRQRHFLGVLADGRERSVGQMANWLIDPEARKALHRLARRGLVTERQGWRGWMFRINDAGRDALEIYG